MKFVAGRLCLDFVNTVSWRAGSNTKSQSRDYPDRILTDRMLRYEDLLEWSQLAGLIRWSEPSL